MTQYLGLIEPNFTFQNRHTFLQPMHDHAGGLKDLQISLQFASSNRFCEMYPGTTTFSERAKTQLFFCRQRHKYS